MNGVPDRAAPATANRRPGRSASSRSSSGGWNVMINVDPGASEVASCRNVARLASSVRYMLTPMDVTSVGRPWSKPAATSRSHQASRSKSTGTK
jgi:hypothetical protein